MKQINIHSAAAGLNLKQDIKKIAAKLGKKPNALIVEIFEEAIEKKALYKEAVMNVRSKYGHHISCNVSEEMKNHLFKWAKERGSNLSTWSNHILEKSIELKYSKYLTNE